MSKAKIRHDRRVRELAEVIITAWFKAVPDTVGSGNVQWPPPDAAELSAAFNGIIDPDDARCVALVEPKPDTSTGKPIYTIFIPVPYPPASNKVDLIAYLHNQEQLDPEHVEHFGKALIFSCGR
jgi:hypothetical protein